MSTEQDILADKLEEYRDRLIHFLHNHTECYSLSGGILYLGPNYRGGLELNRENPVDQKFIDKFCGLLNEYDGWLDPDFPKKYKYSLEMIKRKETIGFHKL